MLDPCASCSNPPRRSKRQHRFPRGSPTLHQHLRFRSRLYDHWHGRWSFVSWSGKEILRSGDQSSLSMCEEVQGWVFHYSNLIQYPDYCRRSIQSRTRGIPAGNVSPEMPRIENVQIERRNENLSWLSRWIVGERGRLSDCCREDCRLHVITQYLLTN